MAPKPSLKVTKQFTYRGAVQSWSNRYHFDGHAGLTTAEWTTLSDAVEAAERVVFPSGNYMHTTTGYEPGSDVPVFSKSYDVACTGSFDSSDVLCPGDVAALVKYTTTQRTSKNHPIYLFNYYHSAMSEAGGPADIISVQFKANLNTYAALWLSGFSYGGGSVVRCGPNGAVAQTRTVEQYLTHRDFRR